MFSISETTAQKRVGLVGDKTRTVTVRTLSIAATGARVCSIPDGLPIEAWQQALEICKRVNYDYQSASDECSDETQRSLCYSLCAEAGRLEG